MKRMFPISKELQIAKEYAETTITLQQMADRERCQLSTLHKIIARNATPEDIARARGRNISNSKTGVPRPKHVIEKIRKANIVPRQERICERCGKRFFVTPGQKKHKASRYCSRKCYQPGTTGKEPEPAIDTVCPECGQTFKSYVSNNSVYCSRKCMTAAYRKLCGDQANNWQGGKTKQGALIRASSAYLEWRRTVFERDSYTCQNCGAKSIYLECHHIKPFHDHPALIFDPANGMTVCQPCHGKLDKYRRRLLGT